MKLVEGQRLQNAILRAAGNYIPSPAWLCAVSRRVLRIGFVRQCIKHSYYKNSLVISSSDNLPMKPVPPSS